MPIDETIPAFQFNWHAVPLAVVSAVIFLIGLFIFSQNRRAVSNRSFFLICLCVTVWLSGLAVVYSARDAALALRFYRFMTFLGVSFVSPCVYFFSTIWLDLYEKQKKWVRLGFLGAGLFYLLGFVPKVGFERMHLFYWGYYPKYGISSKIFILFFFAYFLAAFYNFVRAYQSETSQVRKTQIRLIAIGFLISFTGSVDYISKLFDLAVYPTGYISVFSWIMLTAYSIVKYRVMDIQTVIHKTIMWFATSGAFGAPLVIFFYATRQWLLRLNSWAFLAMASATFVLFTLYSRHVQPRIDHLFQRRKWDLSRALEKFSDELVRLQGLDEVRTHILNTVEEIIYASNVSLAIRKEADTLETVRSKGPVVLRKGVSRPFLDWLETHDMIISQKYIAIDPRLAEVAGTAQDYFKMMQADLCIPLIVDNKLLAVLNIGQKKNLQEFHAEEVMFLSDFRRSAAIALSNALHLMAMQENLRKWNEELERKVDERTRELNATQAQLVQAEKLATLGTLAGGVAHEINNPLAAVLANAQILKMGAKQDDLESLDLIEEGAKRCQAIVQKLMKYARKPMGPEKSGAVDIHKVVDSTLAFLKHQLDQENIQIIREEAEGIPAIEGNSNELEQVLTNLILNSKDAIHQAGRAGEIKIKTFQQNGSVKIMVSDNGAGISKENLNKIFDPFFTTKEIGKGTGLGLAVSFGIIEKHKGKIEVASNPGQGATFTIGLPKK